MPLGITEATLKHHVRGAARSALAQSQLEPKSEIDLALLLIVANPKIVHVDPSYHGENLGFLIVGKESVQATRTSFLNVNWFAVATAVIALTRVPNDPSSYVMFLSAFAAALTSKLSHEQAAFFVACKLLDDEERPASLANISAKVGALICRPAYSQQDAEKLIDSIRAQGIRIDVGPGPDRLVEYEEHAMFLPI
ncbi:hypothetical protein [Silanimonas sp.]|uniref:hypothetical protein n=1 Tax=Silanimonas sp. TaxID=1929290 RepID=UPI0022C11707|nr:hypothetical protein [Silanimonas sp.]MCZ8165504.1 hypothetical protein [Silanimonas sp.]